MERCYCCKNKGIHRWGKYWLCDKCHERHLKTHQSKDEDPTINIPEMTRFFANGWYTQGEGKIFLSLMDDPVEIVLNHEIMHHVLNIFIDPPTSYDLDNIPEELDPYHGLSYSAK